MPYTLFFSMDRSFRNVPLIIPRLCVTLRGESESSGGEKRGGKIAETSAAQSPGYFPEAEVTTGQSASEWREKLKVLRTSRDVQRVNEESGDDRGGGGKK